MGFGEGELELICKMKKTSLKKKNESPLEKKKVPVYLMVQTE